MKKAVLFLALMFVVAVSAQDTKPTFEKVGEMVKATYFHDNGEIAQTGYMLNGKLHGDWVMFDTQGKKIATGQYVNGTKTGKWFFWKSDVLKEVDFTDNRIVNVTNWSQGEVVSVNQ
ncbi:toxin-antitoxin system YwqK family antitoxin [Flagellimonas beolgyonensis]|jgi:antitoxin component YwqK of YwqJK toxin-antitoxin module|uniref:toxin-antitoxin system YwqK family antitoxin n=1 Tax=Flagellimonas beolgyonensis TaxID=864064 RepID=UPI000F8DBA4C|nr:nicotinic acid mononucleotide adenyltransferase [Allomuricauda beolgyonensis]